MGIKISDLPTVLSAAKTDIVPAMSGTSTKKLTVGQILDILIAGASSGYNDLAKIETALGLKADASAVTTALAAKADTSALAAKVDKSSVAYGECRLTLSGGNLLLSRRNGRILTINGNHEVIPSGGVTLAATGTTAGTLYYIYAFMNSGTMTLEASTTAYAVDATTGLALKSGDATRTLVGMARPVTGPAWVFSNSQKFVASYFNRRSVRASSAFTADRTTTSATMVELNTEIRCEFLAWGDEAATAGVSGSWYNSAGNSQFMAIGLDGVSTRIAGSAIDPASNEIVPCSGFASFDPAEGYRFATLAGRTSAGTATWLGTGDGACTLTVNFRG